MGFMMPLSNVQPYSKGEGLTGMVPLPYSRSKPGSVTFKYEDIMHLE